jgi:lactoylglutathione lyase
MLWIKLESFSDARHGAISVLPWPPLVSLDNACWVGPVEEYMVVVKSQGTSLFQKVDCVMVRVADLDEGLAFYERALGHQLIWRTSEAAGLRMDETDTELVLHTMVGPEVDMLVQDLAPALAAFLEAGGRLLARFELPIGYGARVQDPFGNVLAMLDLSKGRLTTDAEHNVTGIAPLDKPNIS